MKKGFLVYLIALSIGLFSVLTIHAQDTTTAGQDLKNAGKKTGKAVEKTAKKVGNKTAEIASKGKSEIVDKTYEGKEGPEGQKIFIDGKSKYYYVDEKGHKQYLKSSKLKDKKG
ncbi:MAG: hypothetical protein ABIN89_09075 [Chitinophagaceae bacterium]